MTSSLGCSLSHLSSVFPFSLGLDSSKHRRIFKHIRNYYESNLTPSQINLELNNYGLPMDLFIRMGYLF